MYNNIVYDKGTFLVTGASNTAFNYKGGRLVLGGTGIFGGGNLGLQWAPDGVTWFTLGPQNGAAALAADGSSMVYLPPGRYRVILSGATAPNLQYFCGDAQTGA